MGFFRKLYQSREPLYLEVEGMPTRAAIAVRARALRVLHTGGLAPAKHVATFTDVHFESLLSAQAVRFHDRW